ncbi:MAG: PASTA domain-containing protein [Chitinophagaceae bacterium]|nr:PASTA domain-containing protein [Chitinophagaceae bacterium]
MFRFITRRPFWVNLLVAIALGLLLIFLFFQILSRITKHGDHLTVPNVLNKKTTEAIQLLEKQGFEVKIQDSVYVETATRGIVLKQLPDANATVKINRTVFLTVNRVMPPLVEMPDLIGLSLRNALDELERRHLKLEDTIYRPDFMKGSVIEQQYRGVQILENAKIQWGSKITLVVGKGLGDEQMIVPSLIGLTYTAAKQQLDDMDIILGTIITEGRVTDTANSFVVKQNPPRFDEYDIPSFIKSGQVIDIWISKENISLEEDSSVVETPKPPKKTNK